jgi:hypothetical protein
VVTVLLLRCLCDRELQKSFKWSKLDSMVAWSMAVYVIMYCFAMPISQALENRGGFLLDTWFAYMVVRYIVTNRTRLTTVIKCAAVALVPLAVLGLIEAVTYWHPFAPLMRYCPWAMFVGLDITQQLRFGFARAIGPFSHAILFGCTFAMFLPLIYCLRHEGRAWRTRAHILAGFAVVGTLSSMSSGPWVMLLALIFCLIAERYKRWVKSLFVFGIISCMLIGVVSNRPFYHVIATRIANPVGGAGWHRARLIDLAIERFDEWWLVGYGDQDPGWGPELGMGITDVTNEFILAGVRYGLLGVIALCMVLATAFRGLISADRRLTDPYMKSMCWALGSLLFAIVVTWMSVSFFGQLMPLFYCFLGIIGSFINFSMLPRPGR